MPVLDELRVLRATAADVRAALEAGPGLRSARVPKMVGKVLTVSGSLGAGKFLLVRPLSVSGANAEGATAAAAEGPGTVPVYAVGPGVPVTGDYILCEFVNDRWVTDSARRPYDTGTCLRLNTTVDGCGVGTGGFRVTITKGAYSYSALTNTLSQVYLYTDSPGTYTYTVTPPPGTTSWVPSSGTFLAGPCGVTDQNLPLHIGLAPGWNCGGGCCGGQWASDYAYTHPPYRDVVWPTTLYIDDGLGPVALSGPTFIAGSLQWVGSAMRSYTGNTFRCYSEAEYLAHGSGPLGEETFGTVTVPVGYSVQCDGVDAVGARPYPMNWSLNIQLYGCTSWFGACLNSRVASNPSLSCLAYNLPLGYVAPYSECPPGGLAGSVSTPPFGTDPRMYLPYQIAFFGLYGPGPNTVSVSA